MTSATFRLTDDEKKDIDQTAKARSTFMRAEKESLGVPLDNECAAFRKFVRGKSGAGKAHKQKVNQMVSLYRAAIIDYLQRRM